MTTADLGRQIKAIHPQYARHDNAKLGAAAKARFPGMYEHYTNAPSKLDANTLPETPATLRIQMEQLSEGLRRCVFVARGSKVKIDPKQYGCQKQTTQIGDFYFDPKLIKRQEITSAIKEHRLADILGSVDGGYGAPSKEDLNGPIQAVVARDADGETANSALTDQQHEGSAVSAAQNLTPEGGSVSVESPETEIENRLKKFKQPAGKKWPAPKTPSK